MAFSIMSLVATLGLDTSEYEKGIKGSRVEMQALLSSATEFGGKLTSAMEAGISKIANLGKGLWDMGKQASVMADDMITLATKTGLSTDKLQEYGYAARFVDTEVSTITGSMIKLTRSMSSTSEETTNAFKRLGVSVTDSKGHLRDTETVFWEAIDALGKMKNETERDSIAMTIFGRSAQDLNPLIKAGSDTWKQYSQEARDAGLVLSGDGMNALGSFNDALQRMDATFDAVKNQIMAALAPAFQTIADKVTDVAQRISKWVQTDQAQTMFRNMATTVSDLATKFANSLKPAIDKAIEVFGKAGTAVQFISDNSGKLKSIIEAVVAVFLTLKGTMAAMNFIGLITNPVGAVVVAITGLITIITLLVKNWDTVKAAGAKAWESIKGAWNPAVGWFQGIVRGIVNAFSNIGQSISGFFTNAWNNIRSAWSGVTGFFSSVKNNIVTAFSNLPSSMLSIGRNIVRGLWDGINSMVSWISGRIRTFTDTVVSGFKSFFGIRSPSTVMRDQVGRYLSLGVAEGIEKEEGAVDKAFHGLMPDMSSYSGALGEVGASSAMGNSTVININVDGARYQDERSLAEAISEQLQDLVDRRQAVFA